MFKRLHGVVPVDRGAFGVKREPVINDDRQGCPASQNIPDRSSVRAVNLDIKTSWRCKYDLPPSLADLRQSVPFPYKAGRVPNIRIVIHSTKVKYLQDDVVWESVDCRCSLFTIYYATKVSAGRRAQGNLDTYSHQSLPPPSNHC